MSGRFGQVSWGCPRREKAWAWVSETPSEPACLDRSHIHSAHLNQWSPSDWSTARLSDFSELAIASVPNVTPHVLSIQNRRASTSSSMKKPFEIGRPRRTYPALPGAYNCTSCSAPSTCGDSSSARTPVPTLMKCPGS